MQRYLSIVFYLFMSLGLVVSTPANARSKITEALKHAKLSSNCQTKLEEVASDVIGKKRHRVLEKNISNSTAFHVFVLLSYNDQDSHLTFTVTESDGACQINMTESFELPANCMEARQTVFKRWDLLGKLTDETFIVRYDSPRKKERLLADKNARAMAFLTQTRQGKACLITKQQQDVPTPPKKEED